MVTIGMNYQVIEGKQDAFVAMFNKVLEVMHGMAGHTQSHLYRDVSDPCSFLIVSEWSDKGAFDAFIRSETFAKVATWGKEQILSARPSHKVYTEQGL
jgi:heme-degrading monooxygenase HmoA